MKSEIQTFFAAVVFYTRIPLPKMIMLDTQAFNKASKYLPCIGWLVGCLQALAFVVFQCFLPIRVCILCIMLAGILITGAMHEDGFIDCCDAFFGGRTKDAVLRIMKGSTVGAYGIVGYIVLFFLKFELLSAVAENGYLVLALAFIAAQSISRLMAFMLIVTDAYAREDDRSKSRLVVSGKFSVLEVLFSIICGIVPLFLFKSAILFMITVVTLWLVKMLLSSFFNKQIGGYTGDCLGAVQQISELVVYASVVIVWNFM